MRLKKYWRTYLACDIRVSIQEKIISWKDWAKYYNIETKDGKQIQVIILKTTTYTFTHFFWPFWVGSFLSDGLVVFGSVGFMDSEVERYLPLVLDDVHGCVSKISKIYFEIVLKIQVKQCFQETQSNYNLNAHCSRTSLWLWFHDSSMEKVATNQNRFALL
ncbi:Hypothetical_protein [Hexamita inflata]|uniref:Hypothetical_protein n=1 Tax=Hexamita inflata TaxID=28002 RepID=A0AA86V8B6_9EUKA|nr:Hypothetical protein HINF_LOCUS46803 [Hexamita inflata]